MARKQTPLKKSSGQLLQLLEAAVRKSAPKQKFGLLFSGGIDSVLLALLFKKMGLRFKCYFGYIEGLGAPKDLEFAKKAAKLLKLEFETATVKLEEVPKLLKKIVPLVESSNPIIVGVSLPLFIASARAKEEKLTAVFSGIGADELFCGYALFKESKNFEREIKRTLQKLQKKDLQKFKKIAAANCLEMRSPFLDENVIKFALLLPKKFKLSKQQNKIILRSIAQDLGLPKELAERKKTAAQYGSNFDKAIEKLAKHAGAKGKAEYLSRFAKEKKVKIAALFSGGKDSCLALWKIRQQGYDVCCLVSILPARSDSFMYHRPEKKVLELQSKALEIPMILQKTRGEKEKELAELKKALLIARQKFGILGIVSGALYSNYQRERIQKICDKMQLKLLSPLWHKKQEEELHELADNGFVFVFTKIAALGLNREWLGKPIGKKEISELEKLNEKIGLNVAGEGGEFESLVLDAPNFKKRIKIVSAEKIMQNEFSGELKIKKAILEEKGLL